jgi:hypothetical protein
MLLTIAIILIVIWLILLLLHLLGGFVYILLVVGVILGIAHFARGGSKGNGTPSV